MRLHDYLDYRGLEQPEVEFAFQEGRSITYGEALAETNRLANAFVTAGLAVGDRIAILAKNRIEYVLTYFAASKAGVVLVPLNYRLAPPEWRYILADSETKLVLAGADFLAPLDALRPEMPGIRRYLSLDPTDRADWEDYRGWVDFQPVEPPARAISLDADAYQMYTSGTTGRPKGAMITHRAVTAQVQQIGIELSSEPGERWLLAAPVFHAGAANAIAFQSVHQGGSLVIHADFIPAAVLRSLREDAIVIALFVPTMIQALVAAAAGAGRIDCPRLRTIAYGASPIAEPTLRRALDLFGCDFVQAYGMTETTASITFLRANDHRRALTGKPCLLLSAGRPSLGTDVCIIDGDARPAPTGCVGEIVVRGPQLMRGYWRLPEESAETLRGGWLHTGDAGRLDDEGYLYIHDRVKDVIISGGENVYPRAVECVLEQHPAVADVAVIGVPDAFWGEAVKAVVVLRPDGEVTEEDLIEYCRARLGGFERPRSVDFVAALPRNAAGKVLKRELREPHWAGQSRRVAGS